MAKIKMTHPDEMMTVSVSLDFRSEINPDVEDPPPLDTIGVRFTFSAANAIPYLEEVLAAIRGRRLFGFMAQAAAINAVRAGEWIPEKTENSGAKKAADNEAKDR